MSIMARVATVTERTPTAKVRSADEQRHRPMINNWKG
jgi:hypothetical protein